MAVFYTVYLLLYIMFYINHSLYELLSAEIQGFYTENDTPESGCTVELDWNAYSLLFWCSATKNDDCNIVIDRWMMLAFHGGMRCAHDFSIGLLNKILDGDGC